MTNFDTREAVVQNLKDAGCSTETMEEFLKYFDKGDIQKQLLLLECHRKQLLSKVHKEEKRISCVDYLVYQIENKKSKH